MKQYKYGAGLTRVLKTKRAAKKVRDYTDVNIGIAVGMLASAMAIGLGLYLGRLFQ